MNEDRDYNILLLKVLAHDLLAPLTAVKWQTELLSKGYKDREKRERYLEGIEKSTELGISLTKHAHVAAKILSQSYELQPIEDISLEEYISSSVEELSYQYERHALELETQIDSTTKTRTLDKELVTLYIWSVGKFFLTCTPPNTTVSIKGSIRDEGYLFTVSASGIPEAASCAQAFEETQAADAYDQKYVFSTLMKEVAPMIHATIQASEESGTLYIQTLFR